MLGGYVQDCTPVSNGGRLKVVSVLLCFRIERRIFMYVINVFKVRQRGPRGHEITLPKSWIDQNKLKYGDRINLSIDDSGKSGSLVLTPKGK